MELADNIFDHAKLFLAGRKQESADLIPLRNAIEKLPEARFWSFDAATQGLLLTQALADHKAFQVQLAKALGWVQPEKDNGALLVLALRASQSGKDTHYRRLFGQRLDWEEWKEQPDLQKMRQVFHQYERVRSLFARAEKAYPGEQNLRELAELALSRIARKGAGSAKVRAVLDRYLLNWENVYQHLQDLQLRAALTESIDFRQAVAQATGYYSKEAKDLAQLATNMLWPRLAPGRIERMTARRPSLFRWTPSSLHHAWEKRRLNLIESPAEEAGRKTLMHLLGALNIQPNPSELKDHLERAFANDPEFSLALWKAMKWPYPFALVLREELKQVEARRKTECAERQTGKNKLEPEPTRWTEGSPPTDRELAATALDVSDLAAQKQLVGVAFSGGGIRSATFNLGVLQQLAEFGLLRKIDYLSTVSGGGYIGAWLAGWLRIEKPADVVKFLSPKASPDPREPALSPIRFLRDFSNYLTPTLGTLSFDTWTMIAVYLRNVLLNQATLFALLGALMLMPRFLNLILPDQGVPGSHPHGALDASLATVALSALALAFGFMSWNLSRATASVGISEGQERDQQSDAPGPKERRGNRPEALSGTLGVQLLVVACLLISALLGFVWLWRNIGYADQARSEWGGVAVALTLFTILWGMIAIFGGFWKCFDRSRAKPGKGSIWVKLLATSAVVLTSASATTGLLWLYAKALSLLQLNGGTTVRGNAEVWGPALLLGVLIVPGILQVGLMGIGFPDSGREWLSRLHAVCIIYILYWIALFGAAFYGPLTVFYLVAHGRSWLSGLTLTWVATTVGSFLAGSSNRTGRDKEGKPTVSWLEVLAKVGPPVFAAGLLVLIATVEQRALKYWHAHSPALSPATHHWHLVGAFASLLLVSGILVWRVDINEFSMHHFYKNRLVRCYLGASHQRRRPNPFTGFDDLDDFPLSSLKATEGPAKKKPYQGPYPIINTTLNLSAGKQLAWQERKACSFIFSPCFCGFDLQTPDSKPPSAAETDPDSAKASKLRDCAYRDTIGYGQRKGLHIGTAISISGAAANPNQGYNTSPAVAFLMTMFDVRLGWWMGNPRRDAESALSSPRFGLAALTSEMIGRTDDRARFVNLSDGGHFDNMGIYELVRRRCKFILLCDAEEDHSYHFGGLGMAIRKCRVDFGAEIKIDPSQIVPGVAGRWSESHCAVGTIEYLDGSRGTLVYIKASMTGDEPEDVIQYHATQRQFPHESTADQWFEESQFESYRALGYHAANHTLSPSDSWDVWNAESPTGPLFKALENYWYPLNPHLRESATRHTTTLAELLTRIQETVGLHQLGAELFPNHGIKASGTPNRVEEFYFCMALIQLVEDLYFEFELDRKDWFDDPRIGGWRHLFRTWKSVPTVALTWEAQRNTFRKDFQHFWQHRI
jgi:hypothetical protein